ncbi:MAG: DUF362 domain-containing protein [Anaerolineae bacterium]|nr:DUF362 domain-containing protein [Anaerolineae bacterium]
MKHLTRREFLRCAAIGAGALGVAACSPRPATPAAPQPIPTATQTPVSAAHASPSHTPIAPSLEPSTQPSMAQSDAYLAVARHGDPETLTRRALAALGGMQRFVPHGARVIIKPNICTARSYEYAATTNPWVVAALVKLCLEAGAARVQVMDYPFGGPAEQVYAVSGIEEQVRASGGEMVVMTKFKFVDTDIPQGQSLKRAAIYDDILKADVIINAPIAKNHGLAGLTLGMKNLMGVIRDRPPLHWNLGQNLADLTSRVRPTLTVIDAVRMLMANGPTGGNLNDVKQADTVIASADIVAADAYASTLFGWQETLPYVQAGAAMGLGRSDLENLKIEEINAAA